MTCLFKSLVRGHFMRFTIHISLQKQCLSYEKVKGHFMTLIEIGMHLILAFVSVGWGSETDS